MRETILPIIGIVMITMSTTLFVRSFMLQASFNGQAEKWYNTASNNICIATLLFMASCSFALYPLTLLIKLDSLYITGFLALMVTLKKLVLDKILLREPSEAVSKKVSEVHH